MLKRSVPFRFAGVRRLRRLLPVLLIALALVPGCARTPQRPPIPTNPPAPSRQPSPSATPTQAAPAASAISLVLWTPEFLSPNAAQPAGPELARQLEEFAAAEDGRARVEPVLKARYGKGGLLDYLLTAQPVAPAVLPDVVVLDIAELQLAFDAGLLQPFDGLADSQAFQGLYPFAQAAGRFGGRPLAVQWIADVEHAASLPEQVPAPPVQWTGVLSGGTPYLFALGGAQIGSTQSAGNGLSSAVLSHYLSAGGEMDVQTRELVLSEVPLRRLLEFYSAADQAGLLPPNALELPDGDAVWSVFAQGQVPLALVSGRRYYREQTEIGETAFAAGPGWSEPAPPIATGWALAITATEPERQEAAARLIEWLLEPDRAAAVAAAVGWLPTSPAALAGWPASPDLQFLDQQLAAALTLPAGSNYGEVAGTIQQAIEAVVEEDEPVDAVIEALFNEE